MQFRLEADSRRVSDDYGNRVTMEFDTDDLQRLLEHLADFVRATGFVVEGDLEFVGDLEEPLLTEEALERECFCPGCR